MQLPADLTAPTGKQNETKQNQATPLSWSQILEAETCLPSQLNLWSLFQNQAGFWPELPELSGSRSPMA